MRNEIAMLTAASLTFKPMLAKGNAWSQSPAPLDMHASNRPRDELLLTADKHCSPWNYYYYYYQY